tara:strand:- start:248 stop:811 length:564 start_codon:yes stop_codon:yes gene_type:complete
MDTSLIQVYDDIIPINLQNNIIDLIFNQKDNLHQSISWIYRPNISNQPGDPTAGFGCSLFSRSDRNLINEDYLFYFLQIPYRLSFHLNFTIKEIFVSRLFLFPPSLNPGPKYKGIHQDLSIYHHVCLYYINDSDGDTIFFDEKREKEIKRITPKKGRIAFFPGHIPHCTSTPKDNTRVIFNTDFLIE